MEPYNLQSPFEILNKYGAQMKRLRRLKRHEPEAILEMESIKGLREEDNQVLTAATIMRMASQIRSKSPNQSGFSTAPPHPCWLDSAELIKHIKRAMALLDAAERFSNKQYDEAEDLLGYILLASNADHPVERLITYFAYDLRERTGEVNKKFDLEREAVFKDMDQAVFDLKKAHRTCEQRFPFNQIVHFTGIQIILDHTDSAERVHFIDIGIKLGSHWIVIMNDLANRKSHPLKQLKITAVCTIYDTVEETGRLLTSFAEYMNLPFVFKIVNAKLHELNRDQFELEAGELVAVYLEFCLTSLSDSPTKVESLIRGVTSLGPHLMVVSEVEANTSGSTFIDRFEEALYLCCAKFDSLEHCLGKNIQCRELVEKLFFHEVISKSVMSEDEGSFRRHLRIESWREYFKRFGIVEAELSQSAICQATLMVQESSLWPYCTMTMNRECMLVGWNEVPIQSVSAWKFQHD